jgi:hypothetical protein
MNDFSQLTEKLPTVLAEVIQVVGVTRVSITMTCSDDRSSSEILSFLVRQVPTISLPKAKGQGKPAIPVV